MTRFTVLAVVVSVSGMTLAAALESASLARRMRSRPASRVALLLDAVAIGWIGFNAWLILNWLSFADAFNFANQR